MKRASAALLAAALAGCEAPDPKAELEVLDLETYWAVDSPVGGENYIAPVVRFRLRNKGAEPHRSIQAQASFRRVGESEIWSSAWQQASPVKGRPLDAGQSVLVMLRPDGEGRYKSAGQPESMLAHEAFQDVQADLWVRLGRSGWVKFGEAIRVERRIGPRSAQAEAP